MATLTKEQIAEFVVGRWNDGWRETLLQIAANANEERHSEATILEIAEIDNPRLRDLELRKLIMREHSKDFHERDLLLVLAETQIDIAISLERVVTELNKK